MGSGKSTLARAISNRFGWSLLPEPSRSKQFLGDLFVDQSRWTFDAQVSFLCEKAVRIREQVESERDMVIDRTIYEDIDIFAAHFFEEGKIDKRSYGAYTELAQHFIKELPPIDLMIFCDASLETINKRLSIRNRSDRSFYSAGHISTIFNKYTEWYRDFAYSPLCRINTDRVDFRNSGIINKLVEEIVAVLTTSALSPLQPNLPLFNYVDAGNQQFELIQLIRPVGSAVPLEKLRQHPRSSSLYPLAYIAAPFTSVANSSPNRKNTRLLALPFDVDVPHGAIPHGRYRTMLNGVSNFLERMGFSTILPHRDVNQWGKKILNAEQVFTACSDAVTSTDLFVGILGLSHGSHYEYGLAAARGCPSIIISCKELSESFIATGIVSQPAGTLVLKCEKLEEIVPSLKQEEVYNFLYEFFPIVRTI